MKKYKYGIIKEPGGFVIVKNNSTIPLRTCSVSSLLDIRKWAILGQTTIQLEGEYRIDQPRLFKDLIKEIDKLVKD